MRPCRSSSTTASASCKLRPRHEAGAMHVDVRFQPIFAPPADDLRRVRRLDCSHAAAVIIEAIHRPFARRREIQLDVVARAVRADERFEAGVLPQSVGVRGASLRRQLQLIDVADDFVIEDQQILAQPVDARSDRADVSARCRGVADQGQCFAFAPRFLTPRPTASVPSARPAGGRSRGRATAGSRRSCPT